ncbi:hypothetical protein [Deinococcus sp. Marseille-Q6407]|uniref:hypothetical protein n=1 Tax=Deinococcus sp. Marseille-Q6407 TaxID=2969223 RepID=UPI0021C0251B|nr:hypothetical protein [Deinococcus sp. Marseille-Q6407]
MNTITISPSLSEVLGRCHAAVLDAQKTAKGATALEPQTPYAPTPAEAQALSQSFQQAQQPVLPKVLTINRLSRYASAEAVVIAAGAPKLSKGAQKLWETLHATAVRVAAQKGYNGAVSTVTFHLPQSIVAAALGYTDRHIRNLQAELHAAGLLDSGAHAAAVQGQNLWATTLWAVKTSTTDTTPRLRPDEWGATWRDLESDFKRKNTALSLISGLNNPMRVELCEQLYRMAVTGLYQLSPVTESFSLEIKLGNVQDAVSSLSMLADSPPGSERRRLVQQLAGWLADSLHDMHSIRWWYGQLWAVVGRWEAVGALQAQLGRLLADLTEYDGIRVEAAWFAARMQRG